MHLCSEKDMVFRKSVDRDPENYGRVEDILKVTSGGALLGALE